MERLYYLDQYTSGKAKKLIKGYLQMKDGDSYQEATRLLAAEEAFRRSLQNCKCIPLQNIELAFIETK